jgi:hypothetical protein
MRVGAVGSRGVSSQVLSRPSLRMTRLTVDITIDVDVEALQMQD